MAKMPDPYIVLGLKPSAAAAEIKRAYHKQAKAAHPDAGGSVDAMASVNEAYQTLSDPVARRAYDGRHEPTSSPRAQSNAQQSSLQHESAYDAERAAEYEAALEEADHINRGRSTWAREHAWEMARYSAPAAVVAIIVSRFLAGRIKGTSAHLILGLIAFVPVYALALSLVFLMSPHLRLVFADLVRGHHTTGLERLNALAIILSFFPLAAIWILLFYR
jgi:curved DNA-binding protein CbpA